MFLMSARSGNFKILAAVIQSVSITVMNFLARLRVHDDAMKQTGDTFCSATTTINISILAYPPRMPYHHLYVFPRNGNLGPIRANQKMTSDLSPSFYY